MQVSRKDILEALGIPSREDRFLTGMLIGVGVGAVLGGVIAALVTPKTGSELRQRIGERAEDLGERVRARMPGSGSSRIET